jgi:hypothetical protein
VERPYGYWEIVNLDCYKIGNAVVSNYTLPNGTITLTPNYSYYSPLAININHSSNSKDHIVAPDESISGIQLSDITISSDSSTKPSISTQEDFTYYAESMTGAAKVKSDYLSFNGSTVISNTMADTEAPDINTAAIPQCNTYTNENTLYKQDNVIEATKKNGTYITQGTITYTQIAKVNSYKSENLLLMV